MNVDIEFFWRGLIIGLAIAAPVGAIGLLCIHRTLSGGRTLGFVSGLGAATADASYGAVAAFGLTSVSSVLIDYETWVRVLGGIGLLYLGVIIARSRPDRAASVEAGHGLAHAYLSTTALTLANPSTILSFVAIFASVGLGTGGDSWAGAGLLVLGVFLGSAGWWLVLSTVVSAVRRVVTPSRLVWANRVAGCVLIGFGALAMLSVG
jgi:threonine/homoserine/homoserine lactone efflux protein